MGYSPTNCQLCGVSFAIARLRRADEPIEAAWDYIGEGFVYEDEYTGFGELLCGEKTGCTFPERSGDTEHVAGPGCLSTRGYSGHHISLEEMKGCRVVQALCPKAADWQPEDDDQDFERESGFFLCGVGNGLDCDGLVENLDEVRHGMASLDVAEGSGDYIPPFHPTCFEIFKRVSNLRRGNVDVAGLWGWFKDNDDVGFFGPFPYHPAVLRGQDEWWLHEPGCEWLVANPVDIPDFANLVKSKRHDGNDKLVFGWNCKAADQDDADMHRFPPPGKASAATDPFRALSAELTTMILDYLPSKDIANLRLASRTFRALPYTLFRRMLFEDLPWLWEAQNLPIGDTDWHALFLMTKNHGIKGLQNRKRIWKDMEEIMRRIERCRVEGRIGGEEGDGGEKA